MIRIVEVGPRDGLQNESTRFSVSERVEFVQKLIGAGTRNIEVGAFVSPKWVPQMEGSGNVLRELNSWAGGTQAGKKSIRFLSLVPNRKGFEDSQLFGAKEIAIFSAASESFSKRNTNSTIKESLARLKEVAEGAKKAKVKMRGYISTCYYCPFEGRISETKVLKVAEALMELGVYEVSIGDTIGAAVPSQVKSLNKKLIKVIGRKNLAMHFHDTRGTALANILVSLEQGIATFDSSVAGLGGCPYAPGAAGNVATEDVIYMLHGLGEKTGIDLSKLGEVRDWLETKMGRKLKGARPFTKQKDAYSPI